MHIPFSMSDDTLVKPTEPDLGDELTGLSTEFKSFMVDNHEGNYEYIPEHRTIDGVVTESRLERTYTQVEVDALIRKMIVKHQETIDSYRKEIVELKYELDNAKDYIQDLHYQQSMMD